MGKILNSILGEDSILVNIILDRIPECLLRKSGCIATPGHPLVQNIILSCCKKRKHCFILNSLNLSVSSGNWFEIYAKKLLNVVILVLTDAGILLQLTFELRNL